jgi:hypothetical protein
MTAARLPPGKSRWRASWQVLCPCHLHLPACACLWAHARVRATDPVGPARNVNHAGTHPSLVEALDPHEKKMKALVGQADRLRQLQIADLNAIFDCEKKQAEDEHIVRLTPHATRRPRRSTSSGLPRSSAPLRFSCVDRAILTPHYAATRTSRLWQAQLEFFRNRLIDTIEEKRKKAAAQRTGGKATDGKRKRDGDDDASRGLPSFTLKPEELKADMDEMNTNHDHYSVRSAAMASDEMRAASSGDAYFDRSRQLLHTNGHSFERGGVVFVFSQSQRIDDAWTLTAMNAVEVTLRDNDGTKLKVSLAQLRNGRYSLRPTPPGFM